jgi:receptor protein-tyrosine kinase
MRALERTPTVSAEAPIMPARRDPPRTSPETEQRTRQQPHVEIDLPRLSAMGYVTPHSPRSRLADEFRVVKRPILMNAHGKSASPIEREPRHDRQFDAGEARLSSINLSMSLAMELDTTCCSWMPMRRDRRARSMGLRPAKDCWMR